MYKPGVFSQSGRVKHAVRVLAQVCTARLQKEMCNMGFIKLLLWFVINDFVIRAVKPQDFMTAIAVAKL